MGSTRTPFFHCSNQKATRGMHLLPAVGQGAWPHTRSGRSSLSQNAFEFWFCHYLQTQKQTQDMFPTLSDLQ